MISLDFKIDRDLLNLILTRRNKWWPLMYGHEIFNRVKDDPDEPVEIILYYPHPVLFDLEAGGVFKRESILVDNEMNCFKPDESKTPEVFINKLKDDSLKKELKSHILNYGLDYTFKDLMKEGVKL